MPASRPTDALARSFAGEVARRGDCALFFRNRRDARVRVLRQTLVPAVAAIVLATLAGSCARDPLPQPDSYAAHLYVERCGQCHAAYNPHQMTAAMWQAQVDAMRPRMRQAGIAPLSADERAAILDYLTHNAGSQ